ncbi:hypothetical protein FHG87_004885, partial [Trinorchestia longiramus]
LLGSYLPPEESSSFRAVDVPVADCLLTQTLLETVTLTTSAYETTYATSTVTSKRTAYVHRTSTLTRYQEKIKERSVTRAVTETLTDSVTYTKDVIVQSALSPVTQTETTVVVFTLPSTKIVQATATTTIYETSTGLRFRNAIAYSTDAVVKTITEVLEVEAAPVRVTQTARTVNTFIKYLNPETVTRTATSVSVFKSRSINVITPPLKLVTETVVLPTIAYLTSTTSSTTTYTAYSVTNVPTVLYKQAIVTSTSTVRSVYSSTKTITHTEDYIAEHTVSVPLVSVVRTTMRVPTVSTIQFSTVIRQVVYDVVTKTRPEFIQETNRFRSVQLSTAYSRPADVIATETIIVSKCAGGQSTGYSYPVPQ